jgi:hypothetical protein
VWLTDKTIRILREEFERGAAVLQYDNDPYVTLFEPYIPYNLISMKLLACSD